MLSHLDQLTSWWLQDPSKSKKNSATEFMLMYPGIGFGVVKLIYDKVSDQGSIWRQWDFLHESCYPQQVWVEGIIFSQKEKNAAEVMIFPLPQIFFWAIKWPWLSKLFANNMLNIVIKRKREFVDFSDFWLPCSPISPHVQGGGGAKIFFGFSA